MTDAKLTIFGSSCNGFGFRGSDLDVCLTFGRSTDSKDLYHEAMLRTVAKKLRKFPRELEKFKLLTKPKVPLIQFTHAETELDVDITLYNTLALRNTQLLKAYSKIDIRVQLLGYHLKHLAKARGICDASKGGLSSYGFVLMTIYYLQQCTPPVVPVLQELYPDGEAKPEVLVDSWNTWFFEDTFRLKKVWSGLGQNAWSAAELWLGMLKFYSKQFDFDKHVVCIRRKAPLTTSEKGWTGSSIAIEDPFNLERNVGKSLSHDNKRAIWADFSDVWMSAAFDRIVIPPAWPEDESDGWPVLDDEPGTWGWETCEELGHCREDSPLPLASSHDERENSALHDGNPDKAKVRAGISFSDAVKKGLIQQQSQQRGPGAVPRRLGRKPTLHH